MGGSKERDAANRLYDQRGFVETRESLRWLGIRQSSEHRDHGRYNPDLDAGSTVDGETYVYGLAAGRYSYEVNYAWCQFGLSEPVSWEVTIEAQ